MNTLSSIIVPEETWRRIIDTAKSKGWQPAGTVYDLPHQLDEIVEPRFGWMKNLFTVLQLHMEQVNWDGNYIEKENQVVTDKDAMEMAECLSGEGEEGEVRSFIALGAFRIYGE